MALLVDERVALVVGLLVASLVFAAGGAGAPTRVTNSCGPCPLVATMKRGDQRVLFTATATSTPVRHSQDYPFRASDHWTWRLTSRGGSSSMHSAAVRIGTPSHPGRMLFTLCGPCASGVGGRMQLGASLAGVLTRGVICHSNCPPAESWPLDAYLIVTLNPGSAPLKGQLRDCRPNQYRHRNSCSPPGY